MTRSIHHRFSFELLGFSDTEEVNYGNARLSLKIWYSYVYSTIPKMLPYLSAVGWAFIFIISAPNAKISRAEVGC